MEKIKSININPISNKIKTTKNSYQKKEVEEIITINTTPINEVELIPLNNSTDLTEVVLPKNNWIFGQDALDSKQFGGNQGALIENVDYWIDNPKVQDIIHKYYPEATKDEIKQLFTNMNAHGCGYISMINSVMYEYILHDEIDFYNRFGFPPYKLKEGKDGKLIKDYNYEYLFLDFYLWFAKNQTYVDIKKGYCDGCETMQDVLNVMGGMYITEVNMFQQYLGEKGIKADIVKDELMSEEELRQLCKDAHVEYNPELEVNKPLTKEIIDKYQKKGIDYVIIVDADDSEVIDGIYQPQFDLYYPYDKDGNGKLDDIYRNFEGAGHAMTIVGTTNDPTKAIVSSWGQEFLVDLSQIKGNYTIIDYSEFNGNNQE